MAKEKIADGFGKFQEYKVIDFDFVDGKRIPLSKTKTKVVVIEKKTADRLNNRVAAFRKWYEPIKEKAAPKAAPKTEEK